MLIINDKQYEVIENYKDAIDEELLKNKITEYYDAYNYIVGDWAYGKLRIKGFNDKTNKNFNKINDCKNINDYITNKCAYGCKYFVLKKVEK